VVQLDIDLLLGPKFLRRAGNQLGMIFDYITDVIGQFSRPDGDECSFFQHGNMGLGRFPPSACGRRRPGRRPADDQQF
jgi:hypothetical protein